MKRKYGKNVNMNGRGTEPQVCMTKIVITAHIVNYGEMGSCTNNYFLSEIRKTSKRWKRMTGRRDIRAPLFPFFNYHNYLVN